VARALAAGAASVAVMALVACGDAFSTGEVAATTTSPSTGSGGATTTHAGGAGGVASTTASGTGAAGGATSTGAGGSGGSTSTGAGGATSTGAGGSGGATSTGAGGSGGATSTGAGGHGGAGGATTTTSPPDGGPPCAQGLACLPSPPLGFTGPVLLYGAAGPGDVPKCPVGWMALDASPRPTGAPNVGVPCKFDCKPVTTPTCAAPMFSAYVLCPAQLSGSSPANPDVCYGAGGTAAKIVGPGEPAGAKCGTPDGVALPPPFTKAVWRCGLKAEPPAACSDGECVPAPANSAQVCVATDGDVFCPDPNTSPYSVKSVLVESFNDGRYCSPPTCGASASCPTKLELFADGTCQSLTATLADGECKNAGYGSYRAPKQNGGNAVVTCSKSGGDVEGTVAISKSTTLCCLPQP
jgi:hypothetical protein